MMEREYIVTAKTKEDLESLYDDLETSGGCECIPSREVECVHRRPISRNTHYYLTDTEAELLRNDPRIIGVELTPEERGIKLKPFYTITTNTWSKSTNNSDAHRPWAMYRCINGQTVNNWGNNGTQSISGTVLFTSTGKNVDVVVVDGCIDPAHPEFAVNENGTGGSRVNLFNWFSLNPEVTGGAADTYLYVNPGGNYINGSATQQDDNNHGCHVAGTLAGNRRGWARDANIYVLNPYNSAPSVIDSSFLYDYIRVWHNNKAVNPITGVKNPSITNHSYGLSYDIPIADINFVTYRGTQYNNPSASQLTQFGLLNNGTTILDVPYASIAYAADVTDAINDGIIFVGSAGNSGFKIDVVNGPDYFNNINFNSGGFVYQDYYHRGSAPSSIPEFICVGAIDANVIEQRATYSNCGPRITIYAPGSNVVSSVHDNGGGSNDSRNSSYNIIKYSGTSMASPNVAGVLACLAEQWPRITQDECIRYLQEYNLSKQNQLNDPGASTFTYNVTASGNADYTFSGSAVGADPAISVTEGAILTFNVSAIGHPFWIKTAAITGTGNGVTTGTITNNGTENGTVTWNTRGVTPGTYHYICQYHPNMTGTITISADTNTRSLQGSENRYLFYEMIRKVVNPAGTTYVGGQTTSQISFPRNNNKFRPVYNGDNIYDSSGFVYPRHPIWNRNLT